MFNFENVSAKLWPGESSSGNTGVRSTEWNVIPFITAATVEYIFMKNCNFHFTRLF
jgi:hypothetical protein